MLINNPDNIDILETQKDISIFNKNYEKALDIISKIEYKEFVQGSFFQKCTL